MIHCAFIPSIRCYSLVAQMPCCRGWVRRRRQGSVALRARARALAQLEARHGRSRLRLFFGTWTTTRYVPKRSSPGCSRPATGGCGIARNLNRSELSRGLANLVRDQLRQARDLFRRIIRTCYSVSGMSHIVRRMGKGRDGPRDAGSRLARHEPGTFPGEIASAPAGERFSTSFVPDRFPPPTEKTSQLRKTDSRRPKQRVSSPRVSRLFELLARSWK
jgi:hypothetical protein